MKRTGNKKKALLISGSGTWSAFGGGTLQRINGNYDTVIGLSTGSLLAPLASIKEWELLKLAYTSVNNEDVFDRCWYKGKPFTRKGKIRKFPIIMSLLLGQKSVYTSNSLKKSIDEYFPKKYFNKIQKRKIDVRVGSQNFAQLPPKIHYFSSLDESYEDFKDWLWCSASFPFYGSLIKKSWRDTQGNFHVGQWTDGGMGDLIGIDELSGKGYEEIDIVLHRTKIKDKFEGERVHNLIENINASIRALKYDIEFKFFYERIEKLNNEGTKVTVYWLPRKLSNNSIIFNQKDMTKWWEEGYESAFDSDRMEVFEPIKKRI